MELTRETSGSTELAAWVPSLGTRARALAPPELVQRVRAELPGAAAQYREGERDE